MSSADHSGQVTQTRIPAIEERQGSTGTMLSTNTPRVTLIVLIECTVCFPVHADLRSALHQREIGIDAWQHFTWSAAFGSIGQRVDPWMCSCFQKTKMSAM